MKRKPMINPLALLGAHQKVGNEDADKIALPVLIHLDAAHRGQGNAATADFLLFHAVSAQVLSSTAGNHAIYRMSCEALKSIAKACSRPTNTLSFTTGEYQDVRKLLSAYLRVLPTATVLATSHAAQRAVELMQKQALEAA